MTTKKKRIGTQTKRYLWILAGIILLLPPLALLPRIFGSTSLCGSPFCMRMLLSFEGFAVMSKVLFVGLFLLIAILVLTFFAGRFFCSHFCPVGGLTELVSKIVPKKIKLNYTWIHAPAVRYGYFAAFMILPLLGVGSLCCSYCNFSAVSNLLGSIVSPAARTMFFTFNGLVNLGLVVLLGFLALGGRAYCNFLCPIGALDGIVNWLSAKIPAFKRIRIDRTKCNACQACFKVCPVWAIEKDKEGKAVIRQISCFPCKICIDKCPENAISYRKGNTSDKPASVNLNTD